MTVSCFNSCKASLVVSSQKHKTLPTPIKAFLHRALREVFTAHESHHLTSSLNLLPAFPHTYNEYSQRALVLSATWSCASPCAAAPVDSSPIYPAAGRLTPSHCRSLSGELCSRLNTFPHRGPISGFFISASITICNCTLFYLIFVSYRLQFT